MPYADAYMAFKTGVADGTLNSVAGGVAGNWHEVLKCFLDTRLVLSESFTVTSKQWIEGLPEDLRKIFLDVCLESEQFNSCGTRRGRAAVHREPEEDGGGGGVVGRSREDRSGRSAREGPRVPRELHESAGAGSLLFLPRLAEAHRKRDRPPSEIACRGLPMLPATKARCHPCRRSAACRAIP